MTAGPRKGVGKSQGTVSPARRIRNAKGWSMNRLAGISGVDLDRIRSLELGRPDGYLPMTIRTLMKLAIALNVAPSELMPFLAVRPKEGKFQMVVGDDVFHGKKQEKDDE